MTRTTPFNGLAPAAKAAEDKLSLRAKRFNERQVPFSKLDSVRKLLNINDSELARQLSFSVSTISIWRAKGMAPAHAALAAEGLLARAAKPESRAPEQPKHTVWLLLWLDETGAATIAKTTERPQELKVGGQAFYLIPKDEA